jgi:hypothetical protein
MFLLSFSLSIAVVVVRPEIYARPVSYFVFTCFAVAVVAAETIIFPDECTRGALSLVKILLVSGSLRLVPQLLYPGLIGVDPWWHQAFTNKLVNLGRIPLGTGYSELPVFHLIVASLSSVTGLDYKMSVMASIGFFNVVSLVFVFLIGKRLLSVRLGLLAALILGVADWHVNSGMEPIPSTLGAAFILVIVYFLLRQDYKLSFSFGLLSAIFSLVLILTHTLASLAMAMILLAFPISQLTVAKKHQYPKESMKFQLGFFALFSTAMLAYWTFVSGQIQILINALQHAFRFTHLVAPPTVTDFRNAHFFEFLVGSAGVLLFYCMTLIGLVFLIRKMSKQFVALGIAGIAVTMPAFLGYVFSLSAFYPQRWFLYSVTVLAIVAAFGLISICALRKSRKMHIILVAFALSIVIAMSFFSTTSPISDVDSSIYTPNFTVRFFFYSSEIQSSTFLRNLHIERLYTDFLYKNAIRNWTNPTLIFDFSTEAIYGDFSSINTVVLRQMVAETTFYVPDYLGAYRLDYDVTSSLGMNLSRVYDSETVLLYTRPTD